MEFYDYFDWITWPREDVEEYAQEIATAFRLDEAGARRFAREMLAQAGYFFEWPKKQGPLKLEPETETLAKELGQDDAKIFEHNRRLNAPWLPATYSTSIERKILGSGLTAKVFTKKKSSFKFLEKADKRYRKVRAKYPLQHHISSVKRLLDKAMWASNCYPLELGMWIIAPSAPDEDKPFEGLRWYVREIERCIENTETQRRNNAIEAGMYHAFRLGQLATELEMRLVHGRAFEKYQAVNSAQRDAARSKKRVPDEERRAAYWRHRRLGAKKADAGRFAAQELGLRSEASIRAAFPNGRYPEG